MQLDVSELQAVDAPERLVGIAYLYVLQLHILHLTEKLGRIDAAASHDEVVGVPDGRARVEGKVAVLDECAIYMPPWVLAVETTVGGLDSLALLDARFAVSNGDILKSGVVDGEQRTLAAEFLAFYQFHMLIIH